VIGGVRAWRIDYAEKDVPTLIQRNGADVFASGSLWLEPAGGRLLKGIVKARFRVVRTFIRIEVTVAYRPSATLGLWVPAEVQEHYEWPFDDVRAVATYSNFRRFETSARVATPK
jgi:hypothetical protein